MRRLALTTATLLALVTAAVTPAHSAEGWHIYATVSAPTVPAHRFVYGDAADPISFPTKARCEAWMNGPDFAVDVRDEFDANEGLEHGTGTTVVWACVTEPAPETNL